MKFQPGQSGNPAGRPARDSIASRPPVEPDHEAVQKALAGVLAAAQQLTAQREIDEGGRSALYFPVNIADSAAAEPNSGVGAHAAGEAALPPSDKPAPEAVAA